MNNSNINFGLDTQELTNLYEDVQAESSNTQALDKSEEIYEESQKQKQEIKEEQAIEEDPRNADEWGFNGFVKEIQSALTGGVMDTASSITTFGERTVDALSGEMEKEREQKGFYRPDFDPFTNYEDPILTKTWWGQLLRGTVHFGTMAAAIIPAAKFTAARTGIQLTGALASNSLVRAAGVGAVSDLISKESDGHNALAMLRDRYGMMDTPLSTKDTDHPMWMKFKNIVEGMGIGLVFDSATMLLGKGSSRTKEFISDRNASVEIQTIRKGINELRANENTVRGSKNKGVVNPHQGAHISQDDPYKIWERQKRINTEYGAEDGSAGNLTTPVMRERIAREGDISPEVVEETLRKLMSNEKFNATMQSIKGNRQKLVEVFGDAIMSHQRITLGRNAADMTADQYLEEIFKSADAYDITDSYGNVVDTITTITSKNVVAVDLVIGTLLQQVRDIGIAGREITDWVNLSDVDGPADQLMDTMLTALQEVKRARIVKSDNFRQLGAGKRTFLEETLSKEMADTRESIASILKIAGDDEQGGDLLMALFEAFSSMKTVNSLDDFDAWARKMIKGGEIEGKIQTGAVIRELQGVMVNGILSGPKTPMRALIGTSTNTIMRPIATSLGAAMSGDMRTLRSGLASLNAMMESIPEAFTLFKSRLDSYWSGDLATTKTRFAEYTRQDENWEVLRRWAEDSGRATEGDKAAFRLANVARMANNNSNLTYSTKLMASMDDAFGLLHGRMEQRRQAMESAFDAQSKGKLTAYSDLNPELIRLYEDDFHSQIFDGNGNIKDGTYAKYAHQEATLTTELSGFAKGLNQVFQANPWVKPFFLFARTGVNGLELTAKHTPGFNFLVKEWNDIAFANPGNLDNVAKYGITNPRELANAQALQRGRLAIGCTAISAASWAWMSGNMTGNGPVDRRQRQAWIDAGWVPRQCTVGPVRIGYDSLEPYNQIFTAVCDIGDASQLMGEQWTEDQLLKLSLVVASGVTSKSYLAGIGQMVDLCAGKPGQAEKIAANIANNIPMPLSGLRNDLGKLFNPHMKELNSGITQSIRNRNLITELIAKEPLYTKYDMFNGNPIRDYDFLTRMAQTVLPVTFNLDYSPGKQLCIESGLLDRMSTYYSPEGLNLTKYPGIRSAFSRAIGNVRDTRGRTLEQQLNSLSKDPRIIASLKQMRADIGAGKRAEYSSSDYYHNRVIAGLLKRNRVLGWQEIMNRPDIQTLVAQAKTKERAQKQKQRETSTLISMYK